MAYDFTGKRALVTGAGKGLGRCIAKRLSASGAQVIAITRTAADLDSLKTEDPRIETAPCDISNWVETRELVERIGDIDMLVNNAGVWNTQSALDTSPEEFDRMFNINVKAVMNISQVAAKNMIARGSGGSIVQISSAISHMADPNSMIYCGSKAALEQMTKVMAVEWGPYKIRANCVCPGLMKTEMTKGALEAVPGMEEMVKARCPLRAIASEDDVAQAVLYFLSPNSSMVTGSSLDVAAGIATH